MSLYSHVENKDALLDGIVEAMSWEAWARRRAGPFGAGCPLFPAALVTCFLPGA